jgi:hypothetical protein
MSAGLGRNDTHESVRSQRNGALDDILGNTATRVRGQSSLGIEDIDIDYELGRIEAAALPQKRRSVSFPIRTTRSVIPSAHLGGLQRSGTDIEEMYEKSLK